MARILIVDDEAPFRRTLRIVLSARGHQILEAGDGRDALEKFGAESPDLILLDWQMPLMDGLELCRAIRVTSNVPIIVVTCIQTNVGRLVAMAAGANDYVAKPFRMDDLVARIETLTALRCSSPDN